MKLGKKDPMLAYFASSGVRDLTWSPDATLLAWGGEDGAVRVGRTDRPEIVATFVALAAGQGLGVSPDGHVKCSEHA